MRAPRRESTVRARAATGRRQNVLRALAASLIVLAVVFLGWMLWCVDTFVTPRLDPVQRVDALYVLGPLETRIDPALALMDSGVAPLMVATTSINQQTGERYFTPYCGTQRAGYRIECLEPDPYTTRGEAELIGREARARGWTRVAVLASTPQAARARMLVDRCASGVEVLVWSDQNPRNLTGWLFEFVHQTGGLVQAQLEPSC